MSFLSSFMIPFLICLIFAYALTHKVDLVSAFSTGVCDGLKIVLNMLPALLLLTPDYQQPFRSSRRSGASVPGSGGSCCRFGDSLSNSSPYPAATPLRQRCAGCL